ncbi:MAG: hypothetical protein AAFX99_32710, partial [Myxococcota bacterium]
MSVAIAAPQTTHAQDEIPQLRWDRPVGCIQTPEGETVRVQCDREHPDGPRCLVAPFFVRGTLTPMDATRECAEGGGREQWDALVAQGFTMLPALPELQPGYARDENGRSFQVTFDLLNRFYLGAYWQPTVVLLSEDEPPFLLDRAQFETGLHLSFLNEDEFEPRRHDLRLLEGSVRLSDLESRAQLLAYDFNIDRREPLLYITTFFGEPERYDLTSNSGWGFRLIRVISSPRNQEEVIDVEFAEMHLAWNLWQSSDLFSRVRFEIGAAAGSLWDDRNAQEGAWYVAQTAALRSRFGFGRRGLQLLTGDIEWQMPRHVYGAYDRNIVYNTRIDAGYEAILLAIVDQPISLRASVTFERREDLAENQAILETSALLGLHGSGARRNASLAAHQSLISRRSNPPGIGGQKRSGAKSPTPFMPLSKGLFGAMGSGARRSSG